MGGENREANRARRERVATGAAAGSPEGRRRYLSTRERFAAAGIGVALLLAALALIADPPQRTQLVPRCVPGARASCTVDVDSDPEVFAGVVAALGGVAILVAILGIRFSSIKAGGVELADVFKDETKGLASVGPQQGPSTAVEARARARLSDVGAPATPDEIGELEFTPEVLDALLLWQHFGPDQRGIFLGHLVNPVPAGSRWEVAVFVTGVVGNVDEVSRAEFYFGPGWGSRMFEGRPDSKGRLGCVVAAFSDFVTYCRVTFRDEHTMLLQHYCNLDTP